MAQTKQDALGAVPARGLSIFTMAAPFFAGMYYEPASALASLYLIGWLIWCGRKKGGLTFRWSVPLIAVFVTAIAYLFAGVWGVDRGMAPVGFVKFLPLPLYALALTQLTEDQRAGILGWLPLSGAVMTVSSLLLALIPTVREYVYSGERLSGFFLYPNTYAEFLLLGIPVIMMRERWVWKEWLLLIAALIGIGLSGSRTVVVVLVLVALIYALLLRERRRFVLLGLTVLLLGLAAVYAHLTGDVDSVARYLTISPESKSLLSRLLYHRDALNVILRHPLGLGYMGYWYTQGIYQTGVYSVLHLHNDLLQFLIDVGWLPTGLLVWAVLRSFFRGGFHRRVLIFASVAHLLLDFDMQFVAMDMLLLLIIEQPPLAKKPSFTGNAPARFMGAVLAALCLYIGTAGTLYYVKDYRDCARLYPGWAQAKMRLLQTVEDPELMDDIAADILSRNSSVNLAWNARASAAYSRGDIEEMIEYKRRAIYLRRYRLSQYLDYADMLKVAYDMYVEAGDTHSAEICLAELRNIPVLMEEATASASELAWKISDNTRMVLPEEYAWVADM